MGHQPCIPWRGVLLASVAAVAIGCQAPTATLAEFGRRLSVWRSDSAATLIHETWSGFKAASRLVVADSRDWGFVWQRVYSGVTPQSAQPAVDFSTEAVVVASLGERGTGGFGIRIDSVVTHENGVAVYVTTTAPGPGCVVPQSLTQPVHAVRVARLHGAVYFDELPIVRECR